MTTHEPAGGSPRGNDSTLVRGSAQLLAVVPHLIGYRPDHCVVVLASRASSSFRGARKQRGEVVFTARADLPGLLHLRDLRQVFAAPLQRCADEGGHVKLHVYAYDLPTGWHGGPDWKYVEALERILGQLARHTGTQLHDLALVRDEGREQRHLIRAAEALNEPWQPVPTAADVPAVADLVLQGRAPLASRAVVEAAVRARDESASAETAEALDHLLSSGPVALDAGETLSALGDWVVNGRPAPSAGQRAQIAVLLQDSELRDAVLARWLPDAFHLPSVLDEASIPEFERHLAALSVGDEVRAMERMLHLSSQIPQEWTAPLLTIVALTAWVHGEGTVTNEACDLALEVDPDYRMAQLLRHCLEQAMPPPRGTSEEERPGDGGRAA